MVIDPRAEAFERVGGRFEVRVLEPSPPAVNEAPWFADDPVAVEPRSRPDLPLLSPIPDGDLTWDELARQEPDLADWCADRWLGAWRPLPPLPPIDQYVAERTKLHDLATSVVSPARRAVTGKIGLRYTRGGFGTPFFGADEQLRVDATRFVGEWFGFGCSVLEELRAAAAVDRVSRSRVQLWPEHFDLSVDLGDEGAGTKGTFGASPGDERHPEPYLYVTHSVETVAADAFWNATAFAGAILPLTALTALVAAVDQRAAALDFFSRGRRVLGS
ncbi:MAG: hypothetical protein ACHQDE_04310 [Acidimicrobiia bacterium]